MAFNISINPPSDQTIIEEFKELYLTAKRLFFNATININLASDSQSIDIMTFFEIEPYKQLLIENINLIESLTLSVTLPSNNTISYQFSRNTASPNQNCALIYGESQPKDPLLKNLEWITIVYKTRKNLAGGTIVPKNYIDQELLKSINKDLSTATSVLKNDLLKTQKEYHQFHEQETAKLNEEYQRRAEAQNIEFMERETEISKKELEFERESNTDHRRKIRKNLNDEIDKKIREFGPSELVINGHTSLERIFFIVLAILSINSFINIFELFKLYDQNAGELDKLKMVLIESGLSLVATIGFFVYYSRWKHSWVNRLLNEEFSLKKYRLDMDRSSWILESFLESNNHTANKLPESIIEGFTKNLFESSVIDNGNALHPVEDLIKSVAKISKLKAAIGDKNIAIEKA